MFAKETYMQRRALLKNNLGSYGEARRQYRACNKAARREQT